ncbi:MAG: hypothetical protein WAN86_21935, partial [Hyphomicrobiaceae bacterium]
MLSTFEILSFAAVLVLVLPAILYSLITRSGAPEGSWFAKYYRAERYLSLAGNLFLLTVCATAVARLGMHFGYIEASVADRLMLVIGVAFGVTLVAYLALWVRAA